MQYAVAGTCEHLVNDPVADQRETHPALFALGENAAIEQLLNGLPDRWRLNRTRNHPVREATAG